MFFLQPCTDLGQPLDRLQSAQLLSLIASLGEVTPYDLSHQIGDTPSFLLSDLRQGLVLRGFQQ